MYLRGLGLLALLGSITNQVRGAPPPVTQDDVSIPTGNATFHNLWNATGPAFDNIKQVINFSCYWDAAMISVVVANPDWIMNLFSFPNGTSAAGLPWAGWDSFIVQLWDPNTLQPHAFTALLADESETENQPNSFWWGDALTQGLLQLGDIADVDGIANEIYVPYQGSAAIVLSVLTGYEGTTNPPESYGGSLDLYFADLSKAPSTPVIVSTIGVITNSSPPLEADHDYAILSTNDDGDGKRTVTARNPWGATDVFQLADIWSATRVVNHLTDWNELVWPGH